MPLFQYCSRLSYIWCFLGGAVEGTYRTVLVRNEMLRLRCVDLGKGPPMLLLHGMFGDYLDWEPVIEPLAERFRVIAVDLPGFGDSDKPDTEYDSELFIGAIRALLQDLGIPKV